MDTKKFFMIYIIVFLCFSITGVLFGEAYGAYDPITGESTVHQGDIRILDPDYWRKSEVNESPVAQIPIIGGIIDFCGFAAGRSLRIFTDIMTFDVPWIPDEQPYVWIRWFIVVPFLIAIIWIIVAYIRGVGD